MSELARVDLYPHDAKAWERIDALTKRGIGTIRHRIWSIIQELTGIGKKPEPAPAPIAAAAAPQPPATPAVAAPVETPPPTAKKP